MQVIMLKSFRVLILLSAVPGSRAEPIRAHPDNPHYYLFRGRPTVLVTSAEHYGAVINRAFDYNAYLDALKSHGLNYTRIYPAAFIEPEGTFDAENTLAPKSEVLIQPWARSRTPGYRSGGSRFDLDRWDPQYFRRLRDFLTQADMRGIVVEVCFFNAQNRGSWPMSPLFWKNNIQAAAQIDDYNDVQTLKHPDLVRRQEEFVRRIVQEVNSFDNVILEICDEPTVYGTSKVLAGPWIEHLVGVISQSESELPKKHLLGQQMMGAVGGLIDFSSNPRQQFKLESAFEKKWRRLRPKLDKILAKEPSKRPNSYGEAVAIAERDRGVLWGFGQALYKYVSREEPTEVQIKAFMEVCPPFRAACYGLVMAWYNWSLRPQNGKKQRDKAGRNDLMMSTYLPYCGRFISNDWPQRKNLSEIAIEAGIDCATLSFKELRTHLSPWLPDWTEGSEA
jgi:hypothetical protein